MRALDSNNLNLKSCFEISSFLCSLQNADFGCGFTPTERFFCLCFFDFGFVFLPQVKPVLWQLCPSPYTRDGAGIQMSSVTGGQKDTSAITKKKCIKQLLTCGKLNGSLKISWKLVTENGRRA